MTRTRAWLATPAARWLLSVIALALIMRAATVAYVHPSPRDGRYDDSVFYDSAARHLAAGQGYVFDPTVWKAPDGSKIYGSQTKLTATALWPPGYPATLAVIYKLTGNSQWAARAFNIVLGALTAGLVFLIARRLFGLTAGIVAGVVLALLPGHVLFTTMLLSETFFGFLLALTLFICVEFVFGRAQPSLPLLAGLGALVAFTGYVRGEFFAFGLVIALFLLIRHGRRAAMPLAALALGAAFVVTPWVVRNAVQMDSAIGGTTGAGRVAYQAHNPDADGGPSLVAVFLLEQPFSSLDRTQLEVQSSREGSRLARTWAWGHKLQELRLIPIRWYYLMQGDDGAVRWIQSDKPWFGATGADRLSRLSTFTFFGLLAMAAAGAPLWARRRDARVWLVLSVVPLYFFLFGVLFVGDPRYHYALYIPLAIFSSVAIAELARLTGERRRELAGAWSGDGLLRARPGAGR